MTTAPAADPRCTCGQAPHRQDCRVERERQQLVVALMQAARERMEDQARGARLFPSASVALRWYHEKLRRWSSARSVDLVAAANGGTAPRRRTDEPLRLFAAIGFAVKLAQDDANGRAELAPVTEWLRQHYLGGRSYPFIAEATGDRFTEHQVRRCMARAHRVIRRRLEAVRVIERIEDDVDEERRGERNTQEAGKATPQNPGSEDG
jgi:hypothetical protein